MGKEVLGKGVILRAVIAGEPIEIGCAASISITIENEIIGKTDVNAGGFRKKRVRMADCNASVDGIILTESASGRLSVFYFLQESIRRSEIALQFLFQNTSGEVKSISGNFLIASTDLNGSQTGFGEFSMQLEGTGGITIDDTDLPPEVVCERIESDWWETTPGLSGIAGSGMAGKSFAGKRVLQVARTSDVYSIITSGSPGNLQAKYTGGSTITFDPANPFNAGETVFVEWAEDES